MWPMLLNLTRDECRLTLRRLELEAYSNMVNVFRAQGALEDNRKKLLEELRAVLHISHDRHSAEARRVSNDQLLATIAEQLSGPNTGLGWVSEGRRRIPLLPRGVPQTAYTEIADKAAELVAAENKEIQKRLEEKTVAPKTNEEVHDGESQRAELGASEAMDEVICPPVAMEDQTLKLWDTELITRKRKVPEGGAIPDDVATPVKCMRNIPLNTTQKHLDLTKLYTKFSQPATSKSQSQSKHSYNQVNKVSSKSHAPHAPRSTPQKPRAPRAPKQTKPRATTKRKSQEVPLSPGKQFPASMQLDYAGPPNTFQASYAQSVLGTKPKESDDVKAKALPSSMLADSPTMQLLTQPGTVPHELEVPEPRAPDVSSLQAQSAPPPKQLTAKHYILKGRSEITCEKVPDGKLLQKPADGIKVLSNRPVMVSHSSVQKVPSAPPQKVMSAPKLITTKVIGSVPKARTPATPAKSEQTIVVSKPAAEGRAPAPGSRLIVTSAVSTPRERADSASTVARLTESLTPKGIPATDLKVSAKALVLNPKAGQKMVVVPAKARTKPGGNEHDRKIPLIHFKGIPTAMKLVPVSQSTAQSGARPAAVTVVSKPAGAPPAAPKPAVSEPIKTANLADIVPAKGLTPVSTPKITNPIVRPSSAKGNVIVVQKGMPIGKALSFAKNGNDMSKIIMGKNVTQLLQASKAEQHAEAGAGGAPGNVIVLELNNEQSGRPTTMSEILDSRAKPPPSISADTPVLFHERPEGGEPAPAPALEPSLDKSPDKEPEGAKDSSSVTDWEMELDTVSRKDKDDDKLNSLHLDLGMSSDSEGEYGKRRGERAPAPGCTPPAGESGAFGGSSGMSLATRTLLSQLQDEGSSSNDSLSVRRGGERRAHRADSDDLTKAKEQLTEKVAEARSQRRRIDVYSTAIPPADITLDAFYLDEEHALDDHMRRLLADDCPAANK